MFYKKYSGMVVLLMSTAIGYAAQTPHITTVHTGILPYTVRAVGNQYKAYFLLKSQWISLNDPLGTQVVVWQDFGGEVGSDDKDGAAVDYFFAQTKGVLNCKGKVGVGSCIELQKRNMVENMADENRNITLYRQTSRTGILPLSTQYYTVRLARVEYMPAEGLTQLLKGGYLWVQAEDFLNQISNSYKQHRDYSRIQFGSEFLRRAFAHTLLINLDRVRAQVKRVEFEFERMAYRMSEGLLQPVEAGTVPPLIARSPSENASSWEKAKVNVGMSLESAQKNLRVFFNWIKNYWGK